MILRLSASCQLAVGVQHLIGRDAAARGKFAVQAALHQALLPEGVAAPENRAQTALLLWNTAGRPEPADAPAFADVADPDTAKAAQWCVEQGLMKRRLNGKFAPGSSIPAYQVLNAYRKLAGG